jgi:hypothetical protein
MIPSMTTIWVIWVTPVRLTASIFGPVYLRNRTTRPNRPNVREVPSRLYADTALASVKCRMVAIRALCIVLPSVAQDCGVRVEPTEKHHGAARAVEGHCMRGACRTDVLNLSPVLAIETPGIA